MACLGLKPGVAGWKAQTNPLSYDGTPMMIVSWMQAGNRNLNCAVNLTKACLYTFYLLSKTLKLGNFIRFVLIFERRSFDSKVIY